MKLIKSNYKGGNIAYHHEGKIYSFGANSFDNKVIVMINKEKPTSEEEFELDDKEAKLFMDNPEKYKLVKENNKHKIAEK